MSGLSPYHKVRCGNCIQFLVNFLSTKWVDYVEEPIKYQALKPIFFSVGGWGVVGQVVVGWVGVGRGGVVVGWVGVGRGGVVVGWVGLGRGGGSRVGGGGVCVVG